MADMTLYEDRNYYYIRIKDYDKMDADAQVTIPFDEDLSVLVGLQRGRRHHRSTHRSMRGTLRRL